MKEETKTRENERKYYLSEFSYDDGEYEITFNIVDVDFLRQTITVAISRCGHIQQDTFALIRDKDGKHGCKNVKVYASNGRARNNIGLWKLQAIEVPSSVYGREFYTYKDYAMSADCDFGFMIWDGKSKGTLANIKRLLDYGKGVNVYLSEKRLMKSVNCYKEYTSLLEETDE